MRISDWSSDVCSSDLQQQLHHQRHRARILARGGATEDAIARIAVREDETLDLRQPVAHDRIVDPADLLRKLNELRELLAQPVGAADAGALVLQRSAEIGREAWRESECPYG